MFSVSRTGRLRLVLTLVTFTFHLGGVLLFWPKSQTITNRCSSGCQSVADYHRYAPC